MGVLGKLLNGRNDRSGKLNHSNNAIGYVHVNDDLCLNV